MEGLPKAVELNQILGSKYLVLAQAPRVSGLDGWKKVADQLSDISERLKPAGLRTGYHNHQAEFTPLEGKIPMEVLAANTPPEVMLQFDVGTCVQMGADPVAWIKANPGRIRDESVPFIARIGRLGPRRGTAFCLEKVFRPGRRSSMRLKPSGASSPISSSRKAAASRPLKRHSVASIPGRS